MFFVGVHYSLGIGCWASGGGSRSTLPILIERIGNRRVQFNRVII